MLPCVCMCVRMEHVRERERFSQSIYTKSHIIDGTKEELVLPCWQSIAWSRLLTQFKPSVMPL